MYESNLFPPLDHISVRILLLVLDHGLIPGVCTRVGGGGGGGGGLGGRVSRLSTILIPCSVFFLSLCVFLSLFCPPLHFLSVLILLVSSNFIFIGDMHVLRI